MHLVLIPFFFFIKLDHQSKIFPACPDLPLSQDVEYSVLSSEWDGEYLEIIGSLPKKLNEVPE